MAVFTLCLGVLLDFCYNPGAFFRALTKHLLNKLGIWKKKTIILGSGQNARGAYSALQSEEMMGFDVIAFLIRMRQMLK